MADPIFKNRIDLKREYRIMVKTILPSLNDCGYCGKIKYIFSSKFRLDCSSCLSKCQNCFEFNKSKDILINCGNHQISNYVKNLLIDYFNASDLTNYFLNMNITNEIKKQTQLILLKYMMKIKLHQFLKKKKKIIIVNQKNIGIILVVNFLIFLKK